MVNALNFLQCNVTVQAVLAVRVMSVWPNWHNWQSEYH